MSEEEVIAFFRAVSHQLFGNPNNYQSKITYPAETNTRKWLHPRSIQHGNNYKTPHHEAIKFTRIAKLNTYSYYMDSPASGQDESNPALWLATRAGRMEPSCPLGTTRLVPQEIFPQKPYNKSFIDQACSVNIAWYWPRSFFACLWTSTPSRSINTQKKKLGQYPAILTSHLVNNPYMCTD